MFVYSNFFPLQGNKCRLFQSIEIHFLSCNWLLKSAVYCHMLKPCQICKYILLRNTCLTWLFFFNNYNYFPTSAGNMSMLKTVKWPISFTNPSLLRSHYNWTIFDLSSNCVTLCDSDVMCLHFFWCQFIQFYGDQILYFHSKPKLFLREHLFNRNAYIVNLSIVGLCDQISAMFDRHYLLWKILSNNNSKNVIR